MTALDRLNALLLTQSKAAAADIRVSLQGWTNQCYHLPAEVGVPPVVNTVQDEGIGYFEPSYPTPCPTRTWLNL